MELLHNLAIGFEVALTPANLLFALMGALERRVPETEQRRLLEARRDPDRVASGPAWIQLQRRWKCDSVTVDALVSL